MSVTELMWAGSELMLLGMGIVFAFLTLLVFALHAMSTIARRIETKLDYVEPAAYPPVGDGDPDEIAAVVAAVHRYRASRSRN